MSSQPPRELQAILQQFRAGNMAGVLQESERVLQTQPDMVPAIAFAGLAALRLEQTERAVEHLLNHVRLAPDDKAARANLATALIQLGRNEEALENVEGAVDGPLARIEGYIHQQAGRQDNARAAYERAVSADALDFQSWNNLGNARAEIGDVDGAVSAFEKAINLSPDMPELYINLAHLLGKTDRPAPRLRTMQAAAEKAPNDPRVLTELGLALGANNEIDQAVDKLHSAVNAYAESGDRHLRDAHIELGVALETLNKIDELEQLVAKCDSLGMQEEELAFLKAWLARRQGNFELASTLAETIPDTISPARTAKLRGDVADRLGEIDKAFAQYEKMNAAALKETPPVSSSGTYRARVEREAAFWNATRLSALSSPTSEETQDPIFLVGFPRSGTTLLDTMLMGDENLHVMEERPILSRVMEDVDAEKLSAMGAEDIGILRNRYFELAETLDPGGNGKRLVDKNPLLMARIPEIYALFPNAKVILSERHPYDVVLSCFMANFQLNTAMRSFTSLDEAAKTYDAVFTSWEQSSKAVGLDVFRLRYERLVVTPAEEMKPLIEWLGLQWRDDILDTQERARERGHIRTASYAQVTEALYTRAAGRWKNYRNQLEGIMPILSPWAEKMDYPVS